MSGLDSSGHSGARLGVEMQLGTTGSSSLPQLSWVCVCLLRIWGSVKEHCFKKDSVLLIKGWVISAYVCVLMHAWAHTHTHTPSVVFSFYHQMENVTMECQVVHKCKWEPLTYLDVILIWISACFHIFLWHRWAGQGYALFRSWNLWPPDLPEPEEWEGQSPFYLQLCGVPMSAPKVTSLSNQVLRCRLLNGMSLQFYVFPNLPCLPAVSSQLVVCFADRCPFICRMLCIFCSHFMHT